MKPLKRETSYKVFCLCRVCHSSEIKSPPITFTFVCSQLPSQKKVKKVDGSEAKFLEDEGSARQLAASRILKPRSFMMADWRLVRGRPRNLKPARRLASWDLKPTSEWCKWSLKCFHLFSANEGFWKRGLELKRGFLYRLPIVILLFCLVSIVSTYYTLNADMCLLHPTSGLGTTWIVQTHKFTTFFS